jgi:hypothetical protein
MFFVRHIIAYGKITMVLVGTITGQSIIKNNNSPLKVRILQVKITDEDNQTIQAVYVSGDDNAPSVGATAYILQISSAFKICLGIDDGIEPEVSEGDRKIYSQDGGVIKAFTHWKTNGNQEINGSGDFAVRFSVLETAFNLLKANFNAHTHVYSPGPLAAVPTAVPVPQTTADMSGSKVASVELPS